MALNADPDVQQQPNGTVAVDHIDSPLEPCTPQDSGPQDFSQITLPSTEAPPSPLDPNQSFKTETNDDRPAVTVIPSSLTPPPSTQVNNHNSNVRRAFSSSQQSNLFSPPATILNTLRDRELPTDFVAPSPSQLLHAPDDELRVMLQACIAENQKLKMETAHHKLQYNLLSLQADEDSKRAAVEHDMMRREVDALRNAEHTRQAKRELSTASDSSHAKYLQMKMWYEAAMDETDTLLRRVKVAKKLIQQKEEETIGLTEERDMLLNRIRENREHFHMLYSPGGIFQGALTPKQNSVSTPQRYRAPARSSSRTNNARDGEHGITALLQAMGQDNNNSAPSTPITSHRAAPRQVGRHQRNAQSMSSLPVTPMNRGRGGLGGLLPSVDLVPRTEPRYAQNRYGPTTPIAKEELQRKSRESTISVDDNEELARQALESITAAQSFASQASQTSQAGRQRHGDEEEEEIFDSQASQAATAMLRRDPRQSFEVARSIGSRDGTPAATEKSAKMQAKLFSSNLKGDTDKRKFSGGGQDSSDEARREQGSPAKKARTGGLLVDERRVGLGIQYSK
ncbi:hypothetical protein G7046_g5018 [Stylonectria norvegica]|nr:hypothetical protein G7046_g5018 [Stylonectria norvegica]